MNILKRKPKYLWKSMQAGMKSVHGKIDWEIGKWKKEKEAVKCSRGFHASERIVDAMRFVDCEILAKVEVKGKVDKEKDKQCWTEMRIVEGYQWKKEDSVKLAIFAAEQVINIFEKKHPEDKRPREAIEAAKKWLNEPTEKNRNAAAATNAYAAAAATNAYAAAAAAYAANAAAANAAYAANAAAAAANAAAAYAEKILDKCEKFILKEIIPNLKPYKNV